MSFQVSVRDPKSFLLNCQEESAYFSFGERPLILRYYHLSLFKEEDCCGQRMEFSHAVGCANSLEY